MTTPITVPVTLSTTETTVPVTASGNTQEVSLNIDHVTAPIQIDFTAEAETLEPGSQATVDYANKHFTFGLPQGEQGIQGVQGEQGIQGETGSPGKDGKDGSPGRDGIDGKDGKDGKDGSDGRDGTDGFSPIATVSKSGDTATITITDAQGTTSATVKDGRDGANGQDGTNGTNGADGFSPIATVSKSGTTTTISITDKNGTTTSTVSDGAVDSVNGQTGTVTLSIPSKTSDLNNDSGYITGMTILSYGHSTWADFLSAYSANKVVYCRASSNSNPATGSQTRLAFMAYVNNQDPSSITNVEFQYYRSVSSHSNTQQGDQVYVYKLDKTAGWTVTTREAYTKIVAGTGLTSSYNNGVLTISLA